MSGGDEGILEARGGEIAGGFKESVFSMGEYSLLADIFGSTTKDGNELCPNVDAWSVAVASLGLVTARPVSLRVGIMDSPPRKFITHQEGGSSRKSPSGRHKAYEYHSGGSPNLNYYSVLDTLAGHIMHTQVTAVPRDDREASPTSPGSDPA